jgi:hypothetical protein
LRLERQLLGAHDESGSSRPSSGRQDGSSLHT